MLTASEPAIYSRFGYGAATFQLGAEIDTSRVELAVPDGTDDVRVRYATPADVLDVCEAVYARLVPGRPGMLARRPGWERVGLLDAASERNGASALQCVIAERDGEITGYARFRAKPGWGVGGHDGTVTVSALAALDPATDAALWRFLFGIDLMTTLAVHGRPVDEGWQHLVSDIRRCRPRLRDALHVRLVDAAAALEVRTYQTPVDVVFEVEDSFCPWNEGRWRLTGDAKGATCARTAGAADLALSVRELGAAYLGGGRWRRWLGPGGCASCGRARWRRRHSRSVRPWRRGCRTGSRGPVAKVLRAVRGAIGRTGRAPGPAGHELRGERSIVKECR